MIVNEALALLALRLGAAGFLLIFTGSLFLLLWRDFRVTTRELEKQRIPRGSLSVLASDTDDVALDADFPLLPMTSMGRAPTNTVYLNDHFASNEHATIAYRSGNWWLTDRGSSNGTFLNGTRIDEAVIVSDGDLIGVGRVTLRLQFDRTE